MIIKEIGKNEQEKIVIETGEYRGHQVISCRVWWKTPTGTWVPTTKKGIAFTQRTIRQVIEALTLAERELESLAPKVEK